MAHGPAFKKGKVVEHFQNTELYSMMAGIVLCSCYLLFESNSVLWLASRTGKIGSSFPLGIARCVPENNACFWTRSQTRINGSRGSGQYPVIFSSSSGQQSIYAGGFILALETLSSVFNSSQKHIEQHLKMNVLWTVPALNVLCGCFRVTICTVRSWFH